MLDLRDLLFADQTLDDLLPALPSADRWRALRAGDNPWPLLFQARQLRACGRRDEAVELLSRLAERLDGETRVRLWAWRALRDLGLQPAQSCAREVLGIVIELPLEMGLDVLAAYRDGTARYLNQGGALVTAQDAGDGAGGGTIPLLDLAQAVVDSVPLAAHRPPPRTRARFSLLTREGIRSAEEALPCAGSSESFLGPVFRSATVLMAALVKAAEPPPVE